MIRVEKKKKEGGGKMMKLNGRMKKRLGGGPLVQNIAKYVEECKVCLRMSDL